MIDAETGSYTLSTLVKSQDEVIQNFILFYFPPVGRILDRFAIVFVGSLQLCADQSVVP